MSKSKAKPVPTGLNPAKWSGDKPVPCGHAIELKYWFDQETESWRAKLTFTEERCGKQYGGAAISEIVADKETSASQFMGMVRQKAINEIDNLWT